MASPIDSRVGALVPAKPHREGPAPNMACLALAIVSGLAGALIVSVDGWAVKAGIPLAFGVGLAYYAVSLLGETHSIPPLAHDVADVRRRARLASRHVYYLLYGLAAAKLIHVFLSPVQAGVATRGVMHSLWPYLAGGLFSLVLVRIRCMRFF